MVKIPARILFQYPKMCLSLSDEDEGSRVDHDVPVMVPRDWHRLTLTIQGAGDEHDLVTQGLAVREEQICHRNQDDVPQSSKGVWFSREDTLVPQDEQFPCRNGIFDENHVSVPQEGPTISNDENVSQGAADIVMDTPAVADGDETTAVVDSEEGASIQVTAHNSSRDHAEVSHDKSLLSPWYHKTCHNLLTMIGPAGKMQWSRKMNSVLPGMGVLMKNMLQHPRRAYGIEV